MKEVHPSLTTKGKAKPDLSERGEAEHFKNPESGVRTKPVLTISAEASSADQDLWLSMKETLNGKFQSTNG